MNHVLSWNSRLLPTTYYRRIPRTNSKTRSSYRRKKEFEANPWTNQSTNQSWLEYYLYVESTWFLYHDRICQSASSVSEKKKKRQIKSICTKSCEIVMDWHILDFIVDFILDFIHSLVFVSYFDPLSISKAALIPELTLFEFYTVINSSHSSCRTRIRTETEPERNDQSCSFFEAFTFRYSSPSILHTKLE